MKKAKLLLSLISLTVIFSACSSELLYSDDSTQYSEKQAVNLLGRVVSRGASESWNSDQLVGLYVKKPEMDLSLTSIVDNMDNKKYRYDTDSMMFLPNTSLDTVFLSPQKTTDIIAYSPVSVVSDDYKIAIDVSNQKDPSALDILYSNNLKNVCWSKDPMTLQFTHKLVKMKFQFQLEKDMSSDFLKGMTAVINDVPSKAVFSLVDGSLEIEREPVNIQMNVDESGLRADAILLPDSEQGAQRHVVLTTKSGEQIIYSLEEKQLEEACEYVYTIPVSRSSMSSSFKAEIVPWVVKDSVKVDSESSTNYAYQWDGKSVDLEWYTEASEVYDLYTAAELAGLDSLINRGVSMSGKVIRLKRDLDFRNHPWRPIGMYSDGFDGTFDGENHSLMNVNVACVDSINGGGLFMKNTGTIRNLFVRGKKTLEKEIFILPSNIKNSYACYGTIVGDNYGTIEHCVSFVTITTGDAIADNNYHIGGICGLNHGTVSFCQNYGLITFGPGDSFGKNVVIGGIVGLNYSILKGCVNYNNVANTCGRGTVGGIAGQTSLGSLLTVCTNYGAISSVTESEQTNSKTNTVGGVCGAASGTESKGLTISDCVNDGRVNAAFSIGESFAGGIVGYVTEGVKIEKCTNKARGLVSSDNSNVGGIVGGIKSGVKQSYVYSDCSNIGIPLKWIGSDTSFSNTGGVTTK